MKRYRNEHKRQLRRAYGISCYVGANGSGKTAAMVWDALPALEAGRAVLSTVRLQDYADPRPCDDDQCASNPDRLDHFKMRPTPDGREAMLRNQRALYFYGPNAAQEYVEMHSTGTHASAHPLWIPWTNWEQLLTLRFGEVLADEMTGIADSRSALTLPTEVSNHLQQLRRAEIPFRYTCPDWAQADVNLRRPTQVVTVCTGSWSKEAPMEGDLQRVWTTKRLYKWRTYEAMTFTELTEGKRNELTPEVIDRHWGPGSPAWAAYDTFAPVLQVGTVNQSGRCHKCGGTRPAPKCSCSVPSVEHETPVWVGEAARRDGVPSTAGPAPVGVARAGRRALRALGQDVLEGRE